MTRCAIVGKRSAKALSADDARRIQALWVLGWQKSHPVDLVAGLLKSPNRNVRREAVSVLRYAANLDAAQIALLAGLRADADAEVRQAARFQTRFTDAHSGRSPFFTLVFQMNAQQQVEPLAFQVR